MSDLLSKKMEHSFIGALLTVHAQEEWNELKADAESLEQQVKRLTHINAAIGGHDETILRSVVTRLKQSGGEDWAVGEMLERALAEEKP